MWTSFSWLGLGGQGPGSMRAPVDETGFAPGSILKRRLTGPSGLLFRHMGVYVGQGQVIHYNGEMKVHVLDAGIVCEPLAVFACGQRVSTHAAPVHAIHARSAVREAWRRLEENQAGRYSVWRNNCEDFCVTCYEAPY